MRVSNRTNGFLSMEEINEGAYYRTYLVRNITEAKKETTAAKECDIVLADIQYSMPFQVTAFLLCLSMEIITCTFKEWTLQLFTVNEF